MIKWDLSLGYKDGCAVVVKVTQLYLTLCDQSMEFSRPEYWSG